MTPQNRVAFACEVLWNDTGPPSRPANDRSEGGPIRATLLGMPDRSRKRPRDANQLGKLIVDIATGEADDEPIASTKDPAAVALGRRGGLKGGKARAAKMTPEERTASARRAAESRWSQSRPA